MNPQQDFKRKYTGLGNYKSTGSANNLINGKEWKKADISREKQDKKNLMDHRPQAKISPHVQDQNIKANPKLINFKNLKDTLPKKQAATLIKNNAYTVKPSVEYYPKNSKPIQEPHGISINVNIQNMLPQKQPETMEPLPLSDRSLLENDKKNKKNTPIILTNQKFDDFQCTQQLIFKKTPIEKKNKFVDKTVEKNPLIDIKNHKSENNIKPKDKLVEMKQTIKKFQSEMQTINTNSQAETISYMNYRQLAYTIQPNYIEKCQKYFSWKMRATLFQWMMHVSYQFSMKRQTFYLAVNLVDLFLSKQHNLPRGDFQLSGAAAMFIASKIQEFEPKCSQQFAKATNTYSATEIKEMQKKICKSLKYNLNPPTLFTWANRLMLQWDVYLQLNKKHPLFATHLPIYLKRYDDESYKNFRTMMQLLDFATLEIQTAEYQPKLLVCAFMYLVLGKQMGVFKLKSIINQFPRSSRYLIDDSDFNDFYLTFLQNTFNLTQHEILPAVQYCATFFILPLSYDTPLASMPIGNGDDQITGPQLEDYFSFQTYNPHMKLYIAKRYRGIYQ